MLAIRQGDFPNADGVFRSVVSLRTSGAGRDVGGTVRGRLEGKISEQ